MSWLVGCGCRDLSAGDPCRSPYPDWGACCLVGSVLASLTTFLGRSLGLAYLFLSSPPASPPLHFTTPARQEQRQGQTKPLFSGLSLPWRAISSCRAEQSRASLLLFFASAHPPTTHYNSPQPNPTSPIDLTGLARSAVASVSLSLGTIGSDWSSSIVIPSGCPSPSDHPPHSFIAFQL